MKFGFDSRAISAIAQLMRCRLNGVKWSRCGTGKNVVVDVAVEEPNARVVRAHVRNNNGGRLHLELVHVALVNFENISLES